MTNEHVCHVTYKKVEGVVILNDKEISWTPLNQDNQISLKFSISFGSIKKQQASVDGSKHCLLKIITKENSQFILLFTSDQKQKDRDTVKEWISVHVKNASVKKRQHDNSQEPIMGPNKVQKSTDSEIERDLSLEEINFLNNNPELNEVYKEVVESGIISKEEFWEINGRPLEYEKPLAEEKNQERGLDSTLINIRLSDLLEQSISDEFPNVEREYKAKVPSHYSKDEFWRNFFKAQYMKHLRKKNAQYNKLVIDQTLQYFSDMTSKDSSDEIHHILQERKEYNDKTYLGDDLGDINDEHELNPEDHHSKSKNLELIRKYNRHGTLLLKSSIYNDKMIRSDDSDQLINSKAHKSRAIYNSLPKENVKTLFLREPINENNERLLISIEKSDIVNFAKGINQWIPKKSVIGVNSKSFLIRNLKHYDKDELNNVRRAMKLDTQLAQQLLKIFWNHLKVANDNVQKEKISKLSEKLKDIRSTLNKYQYDHGEIGKEIASMYIQAIQKSLEAYENLMYKKF